MATTADSNSTRGSIGEGVASKPADLLYLDQVARLAKIPQFWALVAAAFVILGAFTWLVTTRALIFKSSIPLALGVYFIPWAIRKGWETVAGWEQTIRLSLRARSKAFDAWWTSVVERAMGASRFRRVGLVAGFVALASFMLGGYFAGMSVLEKLCFMPMIAITAFSAGVALYSVSLVARFVRELGNFDFRVDGHRFGLMKIGSGLARCYLMAGGIWIIIASSGSVPVSLPISPVFYVGPPSLVIILWSFVWCQIPLHRRMVEFKRESLFSLQHEIETLSEDSSSEPRRPTSVYLTLAQIRLRMVTELPEWPFAWKSFVGVLATAVSPLVIPVLEIIVAKK